MAWDIQVTDHKQSNGDVTVIGKWLDNEGNVMFSHSMNVPQTQEGANKLKEVLFNLKTNWDISEQKKETFKSLCITELSKE